MKSQIPSLGRFKGFTSAEGGEFRSVNKKKRQGRDAGVALKKDRDDAAGTEAPTLKGAYREKRKNEGQYEIHSSK